MPTPRPHPLQRAARLLLLPAVAVACARPSSAPPATAVAAGAPAAWDTTRALPGARDHHVTFALGEGDRQALVVAGGMLGGVARGQHTAEVWGSRVAPDGTLGEWRALPPLPEPRAGASVAGTGRFVVLTSGITTGNRAVASTLVGWMGEDGALGGWREAAALPAARFHHASVHHRGHVYVLGGLDRGRASRTVFRARLAADGTLGAWEALDSLPSPRSHHVAFVHGDAIYVAGGLAATPRDVDQVLSDVLRARVGADGRPGAWEVVSTMDSSYVAAAAVVHGDRVMLVGGVENGRRYSDRVLTAPLRRDGGVGPWSVAEGRLPAARAHVHQVPLVRGRLYSAAGVGATPLASVFVSAPLGR